MSKYITVFITKKLSSKQINNLAIDYNLMFVPLSNPFVENQLKNQELNYYLAEWIENEFDTAIPNDLGDNIDLPITFKNDILEYIAEQVTIRKRVIKSCKKNWYDFLDYLFLIDKSQYVGLMSHWYTDTFEKEKIPIKKVVETNIQDFKKYHVLDSIEEDILYLIRIGTEGDVH